MSMKLREDYWLLLFQNIFKMFLKCFLYYCLIIWEIIFLTITRWSVFTSKHFFDHIQTVLYWVLQFLIGCLITVLKQLCVLGLWVQQSSIKATLWRNYHYFILVTKHCISNSGRSRRKQNCLLLLFPNFLGYLSWYFQLILWFIMVIRIIWVVYKQMLRPPPLKNLVCPVRSRAEISPGDYVVSHLRTAVLESWTYWLCSKMEEQVDKHLS